MAKGNCISSSSGEMSNPGIQEPEHHLTYFFAARNLFEHLRDTYQNEDIGKYYYQIFDLQDLRHNNITGFTECEEDGVFNSPQTGICVLGRGNVRHSHDNNYGGDLDSVVSEGPELFYIKPVNSGRSGAGAAPLTTYQIFLQNGTKIGCTQRNGGEVVEALHTLYAKPVILQARQKQAKIQHELYAMDQQKRKAEIQMELEQHRSMLERRHQERDAALALQNGGGDIGARSTSAEEDLRRMMSAAHLSAAHSRDHTMVNYVRPVRPDERS